MALQDVKEWTLTLINEKLNGQCLDNKVKAKTKNKQKKEVVHDET